MVRFMRYSNAEVHGVDDIAADDKAFLRTVRDNGEVVVTLSDGTVKRRQLHRSLTVQAARTRAGRLMDMSSAYKHFFVSPFLPVGSRPGRVEPGGARTSAVLGRSAPVRCVSIRLRLHAIRARIETNRHCAL